MKRRGFFQSLAKAAAIVALAPQLAFRAPAVAPEVVSLLWGVPYNEGGFKLRRYSKDLGRIWKEAYWSDRFNDWMPCNVFHPVTGALSVEGQVRTGLGLVRSVGAVCSRGGKKGCAEQAESTQPVDKLARPAVLETATF